MDAKARGKFAPIAETLRSEVRKAQPRGDQPTRLGTEAELSTRFGVSRNTLRKALAELANDGLVYSEPARGWFIGGEAGRPTAVEPAAIVAELQGKITSGEFGEGAKFTTAPAIAEQYGVTLYVARQVLHALAAQNLIESQHGKGWYVRRWSA